MAKITKKRTVTLGKPITDFFTRASKPQPQPSKKRVSSSIPSPASSSEDIKPTSTPKTTGVSNNSIHVASIASKRTTESSSKVDGREFVDGAKSRASTLLNSKKAQFDSIKVSRRRRGKCDSDSDFEMASTAVYVNLTPNPRNRKKARLSTPEDPLRGGLLDPSNQSEEVDLASMKEQAHLPTLNLEKNESMEICEDNNLVLEPKTKATSTNCHNGQIPTPPLTISAPTPIPLDPATKTAQIIAQIKERAYAKTHCSPKVDPLEFDDDLDDSDGDFLPVLPFVTKPASSKGNTLVAAALKDTSINRASRYLLRSRSPVLSSSNSSPSFELSKKSLSRKCPSPPKVVKDCTGKGKKTVACVPFDTLLREKKVAEKSGKGHDAFCRAETTTDKFGEDHLLEGMGEDDLDDQDAALAVRDRDWLINRPITPDSNRGDGDDLRLGNAERRKPFGGDGGKAIMGILEHDKIAKQEVLNLQVPGLRFWSVPRAHNTSMVVDEGPSIAEISVGSPVISLLKASIQRGDFCRAAMILNVDLLSTVKPIEQSTIVQYLCELVLAPHHTSLTEAASRALESYWRLKTSSSRLSFSQVLISVQRLGADGAVLASQKWPVSSMPHSEDATTELREDFTRRLIILVNAFTRARKFRTEEAPDLVLLLLLIGTDISTSHDLQLDIIQSINLICNCAASKDVSFEVALCSKVLNCIAGYEPMNKARLITLLSAGSGSTKRIASFVAYCVIIDRTTAIAEIYTELPPLDDVLEQLRPSSSLGSSKFSLSETTNYLDLGYYISILAIALSNVRGYVTEERPTSKTKQPTALPLFSSPHKRTESPKDLQLVYTALETLHSNISDSKALHLERSHTKAILKGLSMYIHYQRDYWLKHDRTPQSTKKLVHYFKKAP